MTSVNDAFQTEQEIELDASRLKAAKRFAWIDNARYALVFLLSMATGYALIALIPVDNEAHKAAFVAVGGILPGLSLFILATKLDKWRLAAFKTYLELPSPKEQPQPDDL